MNDTNNKDIQLTEKLVKHRIEVYKECREKIDELKMRMIIALKLEKEGKVVNKAQIVNEMKQVQMRLDALLA